MRAEDLKAQLAHLQALVPVCELPGWELVERYAKTQLAACKEQMYGVSDPDAARYMAKCQFYRGQGDTWLWLMEMRSRVAMEIADIRQRLAALEKEE